MPPITISNREDLLMEQVLGLELVVHGLDDLFLSNNDQDLADQIRLDRSRARETLFIKEAELDAVRAMSVIPEANEAEIQAVRAALEELDKFVTADQQAHESLKLLVAIADKISSAGKASAA